MPNENPSMKPRTHLLVIDPQNDFCDLPAGGQGTPALPVPGADADMRRVADLIARGGQGLDAISVTLDTHHRLDIAHPTFWTTGEGGDVAPFTAITAADVRAGRYTPRDPAASARTLDYLDKLETAGRYTLMVWPVHCEVGSWGQQVHAGVGAALRGWEAAGHGRVNEVVKAPIPGPSTTRRSRLKCRTPTTKARRSMRTWCACWAMPAPCMS
jgi:nicotinamidase-related amidase